MVRGQGEFATDARSIRPHTSANVCHLRPSMRRDTFGASTNPAPVSASSGRGRRLREHAGRSRHMVFCVVNPCVMLKVGVILGGTLFPERYPCPSGDRSRRRFSPTPSAWHFSIGCGVPRQRVHDSTGASVQIVPACAESVTLFPGLMPAATPASMPGLPAFGNDGSQRVLTRAILLQHRRAHPAFPRAHGHPSSARRVRRSFQGARWM